MDNKLQTEQHTGVETDNTAQRPIRMEKEGENTERALTGREELSGWEPSEGRRESLTINMPARG